MISVLRGKRLIMTLQAVEIDPTNPTRFETKKLSWKERLFSRPWRPWISSRTISVPNYRPIIISTPHAIYYHPSLEADIQRLLEYPGKRNES